MTLKSLGLSIGTLILILGLAWLLSACGSDDDPLDPITDVGAGIEYVRIDTPVGEFDCLITLRGDGLWCQEVGS